MSGAAIGDQESAAGRGRQERPAVPAEPSAPALGAAVPYLAVRDARRAIEWYRRVLGGRLRGEPVVMPDGRVGHAEIELGGGVLYLADEHPEIGVRAPEPAHASVSLVLTVERLDTVVAAATGDGASLDRGPYQAHGVRNATVTDPFGHRWLLQEPLAAGGGRPRPGDIGFASVWVADAERAAAFYGAVLGWEYQPGHDTRGRLVRGATPSQGLWGEQPRSTLFCSYVVDDLGAAMARVRAAGGVAGEATRQPYGLRVDCTDDQGMRFALYQPAAVAERGSDAGRRPRDGDLSYVTLEVPDADRARDFYASVLGWRLQPGRTTGWQVVGTTPPVGISGGHVPPAGVPVWRVTDAVAATARVRAAGGSAGAPAREPYGLIAECADDQGTRFALLQSPG